MSTPGFDAQAWFQKQFDELTAIAEQGSPALKATVKPKILGLLAQYRLKLPLAVYQERVVQTGGVLYLLGECTAALAECYGPILKTAADGGLAAHGVHTCDCALPHHELLSVFVGPSDVGRSDLVRGN